MFITILNSILWFFGIHGTAVIDSFMGPLWYAARFANLDAFNAAADAVRPVSYTHLDVYKRQAPYYLRWM